MRKGFTLVEMVLAIGLVTAMSGVLMAQYRGYNRRQAVRNTAERLKQVFIEARSNAQSGKKDCAVCGGGDGLCNEANDLRLLGWSVSINATNDSYTINGLCGASTFMDRTETFSDIIDISLGGASSVLFKPLNGGTNLPGNMTVNVVSGTNNAMVTVASDGEVSITL